MRNKVLLIAALAFLLLKANAQNLDSTMAVYAENYQQEKIHIHFDKAVYNPGETIWFKAYIMAGSDPSVYSKNLYMDWFDQQGKLVTHTVVPVIEASARGQFMVPEKYAGKLLHGKAYTNWMLNFDTAFLFNKDIRISQPTTAAKTAAEKAVASIQFFPEGGDLISGFSTRIAFLANNQFGLPVNVRGAVKNSKNELVDSFMTEHDGMGSFSIDADAKEKYTATWVDEYGIAHTSNIQQVKATGATLQVQPTTTKIVFIIKRNAEATPNLKTLNCIASMNQFTVYKSRINLSAKLSGIGEIPLNELPTGILQITLFDANWMPVAERIVFVNNQEHEFIPDLRIVTKGVAKLAKNVVEITVSDTVLSNMSLAVTDGDLLSDSSSNIISQMLLSGDIKGYIHNPAYYFSSEADTVKQHLDLVMLTHGWRRFNWQDVMASKTPAITHAKETDYMKLEGNVYGVNFATMKPGQLINLILQAKDSTVSKGKQMLFLPVSKTGSFVRDGVTFYDTIKVYYQFNGDKKLTDRAEVRFGTGHIQPPAKLFSTIAASPLFLSLKTKDSIALEKSKFFYNEKIKLDKMLAATMLDEVTVKTRTKSAKDILDEKYTSGLFAGGDATQFDVMNDPFAQGALDVFSYLQGRVAGLQINNGGGETTFSWRGGTPSLFLDEVQQQDPDQLRTISMNDVAYIKVFRPPFFGASGGGAGGAIAVYTRKGGDQKYTPGQGLGYALVAGYTRYKEFYSPDYTLNQTSQPDVRTTLYWNPYVLTDKKTKTVRIEFFNNDVSKKIRYVLEGVDANGKLARIEKMVQ